MMAQLRNEPIPEEELALGNAGMTRRIVYLDSVMAVDEDWPAAKAFGRLVDRFIDLSRAEEEESQAREEQRGQASVVQSNGGTHPMTPPAGG